MTTRIVRQNWKYNGVLTNVTSAVLSDPTGTYGVKRNDTSAVVVANNTAMNNVATGQYDYSFTDPGVAMTGYVKFVYAGATYYFEQDLPAHPASTIGVGCDYTSLVNEIAYDCFGLRPTATDVITDGVASANQTTDILKAIAKGMRFVYSAHTWRFLRPRVTITTRAAYSTGTITVSAGGTVTGSGTTFPTYSASAGGVLYITGIGSFAVATYASPTSLTLTAYTGGAISTATSYTLGFNTYPMPTTVETLEGFLTYPEGYNWSYPHLNKVSEQDIRIALMRNNSPARPDRYAELMETFDPMAGSERSVILYPVPDASYVLTAIGVAKISMIDAVNQYPLGGDVLAGVITEACLAAAERDIQRIDEGHADAVHSRALIPMLAIAIQRDKERGSPETLGIDYGPESNGAREFHDTDRRIWWEGGGPDGPGYL